MTRTTGYIYEAAQILSDGTDLSQCITILEDAASPITQKYTEQLYQDIINKGHIDFGDIQKSAGDITKYSGYQSMKNTLSTLADLAREQNSTTVSKYVALINAVLSKLMLYRPEYVKGFLSNVDFTKIEYCTFVFTCVEATSTLLYEFVDYIKNPTATSYEIVLRDNKLRANSFFFEQLAAFDRGTTPPAEHQKMLAMYNNKGRSNFIGSSTLLGIAAVSAAALAVIPITRRVIYTVYKLRGDLSEAFAMQASFLEMNKLCIENNSEFTSEKKASIIAKQKKQMQILMKLSDKLKVKNAKAVMDASKEEKTANRSISRSSVANDIEDEPLVLL